MRIRQDAHQRRVADQRPHARRRQMVGNPTQHPGPASAQTDSGGQPVSVVQD